MDEFHAISRTMSYIMLYMYIYIFPKLDEIDPCFPNFWTVLRLVTHVLPHFFYADGCLHPEQQMFTSVKDGNSLGILARIAYTYNLYIYMYMYVYNIYMYIYLNWCFGMFTHAMSCWRDCCHWWTQHNIFLGCPCWMGQGSEDPQIMVSGSTDHRGAL